MPLFLIQHIDALITAAGGLLMSFFAYAPGRQRHLLAPSQQRAIKFLRLGGPLLVLFGLFQLIPAQPKAQTWERFQTSDGVASVDFPAAPESKQQVDTVDGVSVIRTSLTYNLPQQGLVLILAFSPLFPNEAALSDSERFAGAKAYFTQQGFTVLREASVQVGTVSGLALDLRRDGDQLRGWTRIAYADGKMYRAVVVCGKTHEEDALIGHYLESFRVKPPAH